MYKILSRTADYPQTIEELKLYLRVDEDQVLEDGLIAHDLVLAARDHIEEICDRALTPCTITLALDLWPDGRILELPRPPLISVTSVKYYAAGILNTWSATNYVVDTIAEPGRLILREGRTWPTADTQPGEAILIEYQAGWTDASLPYPVRQALRMLAAHWYENREAVTLGNTAAVESRPMAMAVDSLLASYRTYRQHA